MKRLTVLLAAAMPVALALGMATVAAGAAPAALAATTCHDEGQWYDLPETNAGTAQYWEATSTTSSDKSNVVSEVFYTDPTDDNASNWCQVTGPVYDDIQFYEYRLQGTTECATWNNESNGSANGTANGWGWVDLQPCSTTVDAQNWWVFQYSGGIGYELLTEYQVKSETVYSCLSADQLNISDAGMSAYTSPLVMVTSDGCNGAGGQAWGYTGSTPPGGN